MMTCVRTASIEEVLSVSGKPRSDTLDLFNDRKFIEVWEWEGGDFSRIRVLGTDGSGTDSAVEGAEAAWKKQASAGGQGPLESLEKLSHLKRDLVTNGRFWYRPILHDISAIPSVHDGRHRIVAAYLCWKDRSFRGPIEVYWINPVRVDSPTNVSW